MTKISRLCIVITLLLITACTSSPEIAPVSVQPASTGLFQTPIIKVPTPTWSVPQTPLVNAIAPAYIATDTYRNITLTLLKAEYTPTETTLFLEVGFQPNWSSFEIKKKYFPRYFEISHLELMDDDGHLYKQKSGIKASQSTYQPTSKEVTTQYILPFEPLFENVNVLHLRTPENLQAGPVILNDIPADEKFSIDLSEQKLDVPWTINQSISLPETNVMIRTGRLYLQTAVDGSNTEYQQLYLEMVAHVTNPSGLMLACLSFQPDPSQEGSLRGGGCNFEDQKLIISTQIVARLPESNIDTIPTKPMSFLVTGLYNLTDGLDLSWMVD